TKQRFPPLPREARDDECGSLVQTPKTDPRTFRPKDRRKAAKRRFAAAFSVSSCVGNESRFQYHSSIGKCWADCGRVGGLWRGARRWVRTRSADRRGAAPAPVPNQGAGG